jgi:hypothetical protein
MASSTRWARKSKLLAMPQSWMQHHALEALAQLQILLRSRHNVSKDEQELIMQLSPVYEKWLEETRRDAKQDAKQEELESMLQERYGQITPALARIIPTLLGLSALDRAQMILQLTQEELIDRLSEHLT